MPESLVYNMDCMEAMRRMPDNAFDLAVVDPPYGAGFTETGGCKGWFAKYHQDDTEHRNLRGRFDRYNKADGEPDYNRFENPGSRFEKYKPDGDGKKKIITWDIAPPKEYFYELFRIAKNSVIWGG